MNGRYFATVALSLLTACASIPPTPSQFGALEIHPAPDGSNKTLFASPSTPAGGWSTQKWYRLRGSKDAAGGAPTHEIYVYIWNNEGGPRGYEAAAFLDGRPARATKLEAKASDIGTRFGASDEWIAVALDTAWLESKRGTGFEVRLQPARGEAVTVKVPASYVTAYLDAVSKVK
jgi:hypothetical protein